MGKTLQTPVTCPTQSAECPICHGRVSISMSWRRPPEKYQSGASRECEITTWATGCTHYTITPQPNGAGVTIKFGDLDAGPP